MLYNIVLCDHFFICADRSRLFRSMCAILDMLLTVLRWLKLSKAGMEALFLYLFPSLYLRFHIGLLFLWKYLCYYDFKSLKMDYCPWCILQLLLFRTYLCCLLCRVFLVGSGLNSLNCKYLFSFSFSGGWGWREPKENALNIF